MVARLVRVEFVRLMFRRRALLALGLVVCISTLWPWERLYYLGHPRLSGLLATTSETWLPLLVPILVGLTVSGSFAEDQRTGFFRVVLARGFSRLQYIIARALAMSACGGLITLASLLLRFLLIVIQLPAEVNIIKRPFYYKPGPVQALFESHPLLHELLGIAMIAAAGAVLALAGLLTSLLIRNEYLAVSAPFAVVLGAALSVRDSPFSPYSHISVWSDYPAVIPEALQPYAGFAYWLVFGVLMTSISSAIFTRREET